MRRPLLFPTILILFFACDEGDQPERHQQAFEFHHSELVDSIAIVIDTNETYRMIDANSGNLSIMSNSLLGDLFGGIRALGHGNYIESIHMLNSDSIEVFSWVDGNYISSTIPVNTGDSILVNELGFRLIYDDSKNELRYTMSATLAILDHPNGFVAEMGTYYCDNYNLYDQLNQVLDDTDYEVNDTIGVFIMNMIYR